ncbi:hypothetical protein [Flavobacterium cerinum]|uniref:Terminase n=1 Tax=Flavobacterium cerinum TaxID=2502784 RepID=A0A3S3U4Y3_9FLAO|nr:hypothetical protein [Flavobacterium cerinum]RWX03371.1 hypothetical protein EPI11_00130 [Flavobacterium cerinum]
MAAPIITKRDYNEWLVFCQTVQNSTAVNLFEPADVQEARKKRALKDYNYFVKEYYPTYADADCADWQIEFANECLKDPNFFGIAEWPREHAKSVHITIIIPMWLIAHGELTGMILMGKNENDACNLLSDVQAQLQFNELFAHDFGVQYNFGSWTDGDFTTKDGIRFLAIGRDQTPRGARKGEKRPNYGVIDDIDDDEIVHNQKRVGKIVKRILGAFYFALSIKGARLCMGGNRIHSQSILAHIVGDTKPGAKKRPGIFHSKVKALTDIKYDAMGNIISAKVAWWQRYSLEEIVRKINKAGPVLAKQEFFHETEIEGKLFLNRYFKFVTLPKLRRMQVIIGYFDPSFENSVTSDFKAVSVWGLLNEKRYCIKRYTRRSELEDVFQWMINFEKKLPAGVAVIWYVEKQFFTRPIKLALARIKRKNGNYPLNVIEDDRNKPNKFSRIVKMTPEYAAGNVYYNIDEENDPDMVEGNMQVRGIEPGYNTPDDAPDSDEGGWFYLDQHLSMPAEDMEGSANIGKRERNENNAY